MGVKGMMGVKDVKDMNCTELVALLREIPDALAAKVRPGPPPPPEADAARAAREEGLARALSFYVTLCGNTGHSITREGARQAHGLACAALDEYRRAAAAGAGGTA